MSSVIFRLGIYIPQGLRGLAHTMGYKDRRRKFLPNAKSGKRPITYKHKYKNYKHFNPEKIRQNYLYVNRSNEDKPIDVEIKKNEK